MDEEAALIFKDFFSGLVEYTGGTFSLFTWLFTLAIILIIISISVFIFYKIRQRIKFSREKDQFVKSAVDLVNAEYKDDFSESLETYLLLAEECVNLGIQIDLYTERKFNSKRVSALTYKISRELSLSAEDCVLNYCSALVYDAGFLDVPQDLFSAEILSKDEISVIKTHVLRATGYFDFVPDNLRFTFFDAYYLHHENMNGTGYPESLEADTIPLVARILRVSESFVSLTSKRSYHKIMTSDMAIRELKNHQEIYDSSVVDALAKVM